ncbi:putative DUF3854 domain-containing protein [Seiridium cardinale]|uniref:DUF3854 domain-containing protein n=1 Tax=Seiridium cardinale TaxID=138064 RepID=A0ABR2XTH9_9PEZI
MVELRILGARAIRLPDDFGDAAALVWLGPGYIVHGDTYWAPPPVKFSGRLKRHPDYSKVALQQTVESQRTAPSERLPEEQEVLDEPLVQIGKTIGPTMEEVERIQQFPNHDYPETVKRYKALLDSLKQRMSETTAPVDRMPYPTIEQAKNSRQLSRNVDTLTQKLIDSFQQSDDREAFRTQHFFGSAPDDPVFYKPFIGKRRKPVECDTRDIRGSGRLDRIYCHDSSPYVYRGPYKLVDDVAEIEKWLLGLQIVDQEAELRL